MVDNSVHLTIRRK